VKITLKKSDVFIPDYGNNLELPEDEQLKFHIQFLGASRRQQFVYLEDIEITQEIAEGAGQVGNRKLIQDSKGMARAMVTGIDNLEIEYDNGETAKVTSITDFYNRPIDPVLVALLEEYCLNATAEVDTKNS